MKSLNLSPDEMPLGDNHKMGGNPQDEPRALLSAIVESSDDAIVSKTLQGIITSWNGGAQRIFGYTPEEAIGQSIMLIVPPERADEEKMILDRIKRGERIDHFQTQRMTKDGRRLQLSVTVSPVKNAKGELIGASKVARDITEIKENENRLRDLTETLEKKVEERTEVSETRARQLQQMTLKLTQAEERERQKLGRVLHDGLQQLLIAAKFQADVIRSRADGNPDLLPSTGRLDELLQQCIDASRSLSYELSPPALTENGLTAALHWLARQMIEKHQLDVEVINDEEFPDIPADLRIFAFQAVRELLLNVVKHAGVARARVEVTLENHQLLIRVDDEGVGFNAEKLKERNGTDGFGLFSIRERLNLVGGTIKFESHAGKGSRIQISIPMELETESSPAKSSVTEPPDSASPQGGEETSAPSALESGVKRILVVDDHRVIRQGLAALLNEETDLRVVGEASSGREAVEMVRRMAPDVVLMDVSMPDMDGIEATRRIHNEFPQVVLIGLSMHEEVSIVKKMCEEGASAFFNKSNPSEELFDAIRECKAVTA